MPKTDGRFLQIFPDGSDSFVFRLWTLGNAGRREKSEVISKSDVNTTIHRAVEYLKEHHDSIDGLSIFVDAYTKYEIEINKSAVIDEDKIKAELATKLLRK